MTKRYEEYCPVAHALCLVGERSSLLVVLELMRGPKRYTDLAENLRGIGTNILASLVDGEALQGHMDDPDVVVEGDPEGVYFMFVERRLDCVTVSGDRALLERLIEAVPEPVELAVSD